MGFHNRIKVEFFRYDLRKFTFIFWGIEKEEKHNKKKRKAKLLKDSGAQDRKVQLRSR